MKKSYQSDNSTMNTLIIAEAGVNHNGDMSIAEELINIAFDAGADIVKFQTFNATELASKFAKRADYQISNMQEDGTQVSMLKKLELSVQDHSRLIEICKRKNIQFLSTAFDLKSVDLLIELGMSLWKIPSGEITNLPYLKKIGSLNQKIILSTGMSNLSDIEKAISILEESGTSREKITVLHCNTEYPTPYEDVNLTAMLTIQSAFKVNVGYSDHTAGIEVAIAAVAMGATIIEKHFTLDRNLPGPDHKASLEPDELKKMISSIRNIEKSMGDGIKKPSKSEKKNIPIARKSIVAACKISKGEIFTESNIVTKRPGDGLSPIYWDMIIGKQAKQDFQADELIEL
ncbi:MULTISPECIES: N-acetylneuraminate synthase [Leptospira]|uniref:N-acetylneuraminate synthase n=1 Tax=Leptospira borgpetersenii serovar Javanica str. UI 09931 TaxID=1049767 RepID=A0AAV3J775_LEPBO|nr:MULTISPECIES: N-acetylneuraminate synthase [Leptospira]AXX17275.1 N-acetylneuraminate synthase [Leptospira borgpetersenii serovar Ceylonica]EMK08914.1 N-acetylneuraminate synthase [Leptospira sp. serovar Kenya str. Sh9]EMN58470.1 N-acetylneuraminate synthase [Leptospira borgpetersenii serovar Javanica str. MK146]EPG56482.1 N-acetylneuraminate synthase [Leptospira borgpetersenii serovar Javanica str. UI 09931]MDQ7244350.1 N-acetylneuraminate synthase [Leptospira borgpetersenii]